MSQPMCESYRLVAFENSKHPLAHVDMQVFPAKVKVQWELQQDLLMNPLPDTGQTVEKLWQKTCFELFEFDSQSESYVEWNFSGFGAWAFMSFGGYRKAQKPKQNLKPLDQKLFKKKSFEVLVPLSFSKSNLQINLVAQLKDGRLRHLARAHSSTAPDFHKRLG